MVPPSAFRRGLLALALVVAFYGTTLLLALGLVAVGFACAYLTLREHRGGMVILLALALTWIPAAMLVRALFLRPMAPPILYPRLTRADAPALLDLLAEIAARAGTHPPDDVYLAPRAELGVTEHGGFLGLGSRRVLIVGVALVTGLDVQELRAGLAHEMGHFLGGETRLHGVVSFTTGLFRALLETREADLRTGGVAEIGMSLASWITHGVARVYAHVFLAVTRPTQRRLEHAADAFSVEHAGTAASRRMLEKTGVMSALARAYWETEAASALSDGGLPTDYVSGFRRYRARLEERGLAQQVTRELRDAKTDRFDTHPSLGERLAFVDTLPPVSAAEDARPAAVLFPDLDLLAVSVLRSLVDSERRVVEVPWAEIPARVLEPAALRRAREMAETIPQLPPTTPLAKAFAFVVEQLSNGNGPALIYGMDPSMREIGPRGLPAMATLVLVRLFTGALLERGGHIVLRNGDGSEIDFHGARVAPARLALEAKDDAHALGLLRDWSLRLAG